MSYSVLDLFAGAGGFSLGFQWAGAEIVGAIESDRWACETFQFNHPNAAIAQGDIATITKAPLPVQSNWQCRPAVDGKSDRGKYPESVVSQYVRPRE